MFHGVALLSTVLVSASRPKPTPCSTSSVTGSWCNSDLSIEERVTSLVANLSIDEKAGLFQSKAAAIPRIGWPEYNWWSEALHGVARDGVATSFPQIGLIASSYNRTLWRAIGDATSTEGRGKNNLLQGGLYQGLTFWAPNINVSRVRH